MATLPIQGDVSGEFTGQTIQYFHTIIVARLRLSSRSVLVTLRNALTSEDSEQLNLAMAT